jgi:hypothetical protein
MRIQKTTLEYNSQERTIDYLLVQSVWVAKMLWGEKQAHWKRRGQMRIRNRP